MSIASEFDSTIENIKSDYEGLENIGADLTNIDKNIYNIRTCLDNIYTNLPKTTGEGSNLSLSTLKGRINVDNILGDTSQDTTTGKNKLPNQLVSGSANGITYTRNEDGSIKLTGTATARTEPRLMTTSFTIKAGTYKNTTSMSIYWYDTSYKVVSSGSNVTFSSDTTIQYVYIRIESGTTINETIYPQLILSSESDTSYEPYTGGQASPNPTYPQDINVVTGTQEVVVENKNIFNVDIKIGNLNTNTGEEQTGYYYAITSNFVKVIPNSQISIQYAYNYDTSITGQIVVYQYGKDKSFKKFNAYSGKSYSITLDSDTYYIKIRFGGKNNHTNTISEYEQMQIEYGTATSYVEHQEQTKTLHLGDIELAKIGTYQDRIFETSGKNKFDKSTEKTNAIYDSTNKVWNTTANWTSSDYIKVKGNEAYTLSFTSFDSGMQNYITFLDTNKDFISGGAGTPMTNLSRTITTPSNCNYIVFGYRNDKNAKNCMLNEGSTALPYEPYGSDKWYIEKNIGKYAINGASGSFSKPSTNRFNIDGALTDYLKAVNVVTCMSDKYVCYAQKGSNADFNTLVANENFGLDLSSSTSGNTIRIKDTNYDDINQYKTWLASNNVELLYVLATPTYTEITNETLLNELNELEKMMSYNGQTNISVSGNLPMILSVSALKGE